MGVPPEPEKLALLIGGMGVKNGAKTGIGGCVRKRFGFGYGSGTGIPISKPTS